MCVFCKNCGGNRCSIILGFRQIMVNNIRRTVPLATRWLVGLLTWLPEDDFFDYFVAEGFVDAGDEGGAGEHELVAQGGAADGECEYAVFH